MRTTLLTILIASAIAAPSARAGELPNQYLTRNGSECNVAGVNGGDPNHEFDVRSTGAYNRSATANLFVICSFEVTPTPSEGGALTNLYLSAFTIDGKPHDMTCTGVVGSLNRPVQPIYGAKTATVTGPDAYNPTVITWAPEDLGGASATGGIVGSAWGSITCLLPAQTAIALYYAKLNPTLR